MEFVWTKKWPTKEGYYWRRYNYGNGDVQDADLIYFFPAAMTKCCRIQLRGEPSFGLVVSLPEGVGRSRFVEWSNQAIPLPAESPKKKKKP
jgi:hypothetical protein